VPEGAGGGKEKKRLFFYKKGCPPGQQKTSICCRLWHKPGKYPHLAKVFCFLFSKKKSRDVLRHRLGGGGDVAVPNVVRAEGNVDLVRLAVNVQAQHGTSVQWKIGGRVSGWVPPRKAAADVRGYAEDEDQETAFLELVALTLANPAGIARQSLSNINSSARLTKARMLAIRSSFPVSIVMVYRPGPARAMQECPAASP
jgi:hypothetical protein